MRAKTARLNLVGSVLALAAFVAPAALPAQPRTFSVSASPTLVLGNDESNDATTFTKAVSATRTPNGNVLVGDLGAVGLRLFSPQGKLVKSAGLSGSGPGEIKYLHSFMRCGNVIFAHDIENGRRSEYSLDLAYKRAVPIVAPQAYQTRCNAAGKFFNYGWERLSSVKAGAFRTTVPFWFSTFDGPAEKSFAEFPGSERWGQQFGTRPLPFGKETAIAIGAARAYVGTADGYVVKVLDFSGKEVGTIRDAAPPTPVTKADIDAAIYAEGGYQSDEARKRLETHYASMKLPATLPSYKALVVDAFDQLWVQDFPRATMKTVRWSVFTGDGKLVGRVQLPTALEVYEVGSDYVLGRYLDADTSAPLIHLYKLIR